MNYMYRSYLNSSEYSQNSSNVRHPYGYIRWRKINQRDSCEKRFDELLAKEKNKENIFDVSPEVKDIKDVTKTAKQSKNSTCTLKSNTCLTETNKFCNESTSNINLSKDIFDISSECNVNNFSTSSSPRELTDSPFSPKSNQSCTELKMTFSKLGCSKITFRKKKLRDISNTLVQGSEELDVTFGNLSLSKVTSRRKDRYVTKTSVIEEVESPCSYNESFSEQIQSPILSPDSTSNSKWLDNQHSSEEESLSVLSPDLTHRYSVNSSIKKDVQQLSDEEYYPVFLPKSSRRKSRSANSARLARKQTDQHLPEQEITLKSISSIFSRRSSLNSTLSVKELIDHQLFRQESLPDLSIRCAFENSFLLFDQQKDDRVSLESIIFRRHRSLNSTLSVKEQIDQESSPDLTVRNTSENSFLFDQQKDERLLHVSSPNSTLASTNQVQLIKKQVENTIVKIYRICKQNGPLKFNDVFTEDIIKHSVKIGEGSYGEIFYFKPPDKTHSSYVFKICPIPDSSEEQLQNILTEVKITNALRTLATNYFNRTKTFCKVNAINIIQGKYPKGLVGLWNNYKASTKGTENECPSKYNRDQLYVSIEMKFAGTALEDYVFVTAAQAYYVLLQVIFALAVAETAFEFEHRDLHNGNVLINTTKQQSVCFMINGIIYEIPTQKRKAKIIDFSLSRVNDAYIDLEKDEELFNQSGDLQYDVYRQMRNDVQRNWQLYVPKTNVRWIQYLAEKCCSPSNYTKTGKKTVKHSKFLTKIKMLKKSVLQYNSAVELAATFKEFKYH